MVPILAAQCNIIHQIVVTYRLGQLRFIIPCCKDDFVSLRMSAYLIAGILTTEKVRMLTFRHRHWCIQCRTDCIKALHIQCCDLFLGQ